MAAHLQQMAAAGQFMPQQQRAMAMGGGPSPEGNIQQYIYSAIQSNTLHIPHGWQTGLAIVERVRNVQQIFSNLAITNPAVPRQQIADYSIKFEGEIIQTSPDKATYDQKIRGKLQELVLRRQNQAPQIQEAMNAQARQAMMHQQNLMRVQMAGRGGGPNQQGFQHLQNPMQVSQLSQQAPQMNLSLSNGMTPQINPGQPGFGMPGGPQRALNQIPQSEVDRERVMQLARQMALQTPPEQKTKILEQVIGAQTVQQMRNQGKDPLTMYFMQAAMKRLYPQGRQPQAQQRQPQGMPPNFQGMSMQPGQQRPMNPAMMNNMGQTGGQMPFGSNMESIINEQKQGMMAERQGQLVVPASSGPGHNPNSQPPFGGGMQPGNMFPQGSGQTPRPQMPNSLEMQQQQQQQQQQKQQALMKQQLAQSQAQAQARHAAVNLQGQPGGLSGPMPVSQTPALTNLNAPVGQPPVALGQMPGAQGGPGNPSFGPGLDARFNQPGPQSSMPGGFNIQDPQFRAMFASLDQEQQQKLRGMGSEKLADMFQKWKQTQQAQAMIAGRLGQPQQGLPTNPANRGNPMGMPPQQMNGGPMNPAMQAIIRQRQIAQLNSPQVQAIMDQMDIPQQVFSAIQGIPPDLKKWGQFKTWMQSTPTIPDQLKAKLKSAQAQQFLQLQQRGMIPGRSGPAAGLQQPGGRPPLPASFHHIEVTPQEIQSFRATSERAREVPEEHLRAMLQKMKFTKLMQAAGQAPGFQQPQPPAQPTVPSIIQPEAPQNHTGAPQHFPQGQPTRTPVPVSEPNPSNAAASIPGNKANRPTQQNKPAPPNPLPAAATKNLKRPGSNDLEPSTQSNGAAQRPSSQAGQLSMDGGVANFPANLTEAQLASLTPDQKQAWERRKQAQKQIQEASARYKDIANEEARAYDHSKMKLLEVPPQMLDTYKSLLSSVAQGFVKTSNPNIIVKWFAMSGDESRLRTFLKMRVRVISQFKDGDKLQVMNTKFSLPPPELMQYKNFLSSMLQELKQPGKLGEQQQTQQVQAPAKPVPAPQPNESHPAKQAQQASHRLPQRPNSRGVQPPAAPTSSQPPFQFGAASPDGKPVWVAPPQVTQDNLQMPSRKRVKTGLQTSSPASSSQNASPQTKAISPDLKKQESKAAPKPTFPCTVADCEMGGPTFASEAQRKKHHEEFHVIPFRNPEKFLVESCMEYLEQNKQAKPDGATPMSRESSLKLQASASGGPVSQGLKPDDNKAASTSKPSDNGASVAAATDSKQPQANDHLGTSNGTIDPQSLFNTAIGFDPLAGGVIANSILYRSTTPVEDTPESSKDSGASEPNSDIPEAGSLDIEMDFMPYEDLNLILDPNYDYGSSMDLSMESITDDMLVDMSGNSKLIEPLDMSLFSVSAG